MGWDQLRKFTSAASIAATISDGDTTHAPDGNSVFDALALKQSNIGIVVLSPSGDTTGATDRAAINAALAALPIRGGTVMLSNSGTWYLDTPIIMGNGTDDGLSTINGQKLAGQGIGGYVGSEYAGATKIICKSTSSCIQINGEINWGLENLFISSTTATSLIKVIAGQYGDSRNLQLFVAGVGQRGIEETTFVTLAQNTMHNSWKNIGIYLWATDAIAIKLSSGNVNYSNTCFENYDNLTVNLGNTGQKGIWFEACDSIIFKSIHMMSWYSHTALYYDYTQKADWPADNYIYGFFGGSNASFANNGTPSGATPNIIYGFGLTNGTVKPSLTNLEIK